MLAGTLDKCGSLQKEEEVMWLFSASLRDFSTSGDLDMHKRKTKKKQKLQKISLILLSTSFCKQATKSEDSCVTPSFALLDSFPAVFGVKEMSLFKNPVSCKIWWLLACVYIFAFVFYEANSLALLSVVQKPTRSMIQYIFTDHSVNAKLLQLRVLICLVLFLY